MTSAFKSKIQISDEKGPIEDRDVVGRIILKCNSALILL